MNFYSEFCFSSSHGCSYKDFSRKSVCSFIFPSFNFIINPTVPNHWNRSSRLQYFIDMPKLNTPNFFVYDINVLNFFVSLISQTCISMAKFWILVIVRHSLEVLMAKKVWDIRPNKYSLEFLMVLILIKFLIVILVRSRLYYVRKGTWPAPNFASRQNRQSFHDFCAGLNSYHSPSLLMFRGGLLIIWW